MDDDRSRGQRVKTLRGVLVALFMGIPTIAPAVLHFLEYSIVYKRRKIVKVTLTAIRDLIKQVEQNSCAW